MKTIVILALVKTFFVGMIKLELILQIRTLDSELKCRTFVKLDRPECDSKTLGDRKKDIQLKV